MKDDWARRRQFEGMESVVATVSGYHGSERFSLIKLISQAGASYVGAMNPSTTHLVCWKFEGRKYELAKKFKISIVNHQWIEDCVKQGRRVPERPYTKNCGQEVGPLLLEIPSVADKVNRVLPEVSNDSKSKEPVIDIECDESGDDAWIDSWLLKENLFPEPEQNRDYSNRLKRKGTKRNSRQDFLPRSRYCLDEPLLYGFRGMKSEDSSSPSTRPLRQQRISTTTAEPSRKSRRLVKTNICREVLESSSDSEQECHPIKIHPHNDDTTAPPKFSTGGSHESRRLHKDRYHDREESRTEGLDNIEQIKDFKKRNNHKDPTSTEAATPSLIRNPQDCSSAVHDDFNRIDNISRLSTSPELSCVICWTDFSSIRGVLPCGHRFCFSCIQSWADHMVSMKKISTCPLCKANFFSIRKVDDAVSSDQKIYSQTVPYDPSAMEVYILPHGEEPTFGTLPSLAPVCYQCCCREPEELLIRCHLCQIRCVHSYCLDPPQLPWICLHCKDLRMHYHHNR